MQIRKYSYIWCSIAFILIIIGSLLFDNKTPENYENEKEKEKENKPTRKKIAFCFLIYDKINHEEIWHRFFEKADKQKYNIYIHYKENKPLKYLDEYKIQNCIETKWGDISLVKAQNKLLEEALKDPKNEHFIFLSNSCVPVKTFQFIYDYLDTKYSYFNKDPTKKDRCTQTHVHVDPKHIQKASQWSILNKKHATILSEKTEYIPWFEYDNQTCIADEHAYITYLFSQDLEKELKITDNIAIDATTFTNWADMDYKFHSKENNSTYGLKNYKKISEEELKYITQSKSLFARKFDGDCDLTLLYEFI
jgi:hypothetical protein